jgi:4-amino-4-deoxy-L-arabinose transferase-like glycosyltransferase
MLPVKPVTDGPIYHLYFAARWWKEGRVFLVPTPFGDPVVTYFPANGELGFAALFALWGGDRLAKVGQVPFLFLAGLSTFGIARRLGATLPAATIATCWFVCSVFMILYSFEANVDTIFVACYLASAYFLLRYWLGDGAIATVALGGLGAGEALGTKVTAMVFVPPLVALGAVAILTRRASIRTRLGHLATLGLSTVVPAGYWFGRNAWITANPLYPLQVSVFGRVLLRGWYDASAMRLSKFYIAADHLEYCADNLLAAFDPRLAPVWAAALLGAWLIGRRHSMAPWIFGVSALVVADLALYWLLIPYRTQQRFMLPAVGLAVVPLAALFDRGRFVRWAAVSLLALHILTPQTWPLTPIGAQVNWGLSHSMTSSPMGMIVFPMTLTDLAKTLSGPATAIYLVMSVAVGLGAVLVAREWGRVARDQSLLRWAIAAAATAGLVALPSALTWNYLTAGRVYPRFAPYIRGWNRLEEIAGPSGARIAYAGTNRVYYLMGNGLRNHVVYVNVNAHRDWMLHDYHREATARGEPNWPDPRPGWDRVHPDYDAWLANLASERIELLVVTPATPDDGKFNLADPAGFPIERVWADAHPEAFSPLYGPLENDPNFRIYRVHAGGRAESPGDANLKTRS